MPAQRHEVVVADLWRRHLWRVKSNDIDTVQPPAAVQAQDSRTPEERALARDRVLFWAARPRRRS
jgi:hypothetical protein